MQAETWVYCPNCNQKTRLKIREDTIIENLPLFCPKCKHETLINVNGLLANWMFAERFDVLSYGRDLFGRVLPLFL